MVMKGLAYGVVAWCVCSAPLSAQEPARDRSLERISLALQQPPAIVREVVAVETDLPKKLGIFTLVPPVKRGEMIRVSVPIGEMVTNAFNGVAAANQRRQEAAARRRVEAALRQFKEQQRYSRQ
jgi:hypothetical protein